MLSAIIVLPPTPDRGRQAFGPLLRTLAALVPATIEGVVRDVMLLQVGGDAEIATIADEVGCRMVEADDFSAALLRGVGQARAPWVLLLRAGAVPGRGFGEAAVSALDGSDPSSGSYVLREERSGLGRWLPFVLPVAGIIAARDRLSDAPCSTFAELVRRMRPARDFPSRVAVLA